MEFGYISVDNNDNESSSISLAFNDTSASTLSSDNSSSSCSHDASMYIPITITESIDLPALKLHPSYASDIPIAMLKHVGSNYCSIDSRKRDVFSHFSNDEVLVCDSIDSGTDSISADSSSEILSNSYWHPLLEDSDD